MRRTCDNWQDKPPAGKSGSHLYEEFELRTRNVAAEVFRVRTFIETCDVIASLAESVNAKKVVIVNGSLPQATGIVSALKSAGVAVYSDTGEIRKHVETANMGISGANFGVAENGSIGLITNEGNGRLVTTLSPIHVVIIGYEKLISY